MKKSIAGGLSALMALLALSSTASASSHEATGRLQRFGECPLSIKTVTDCIHSVSGKGEFRVGTRTVPLAKPVRLQGGAERSGEQVKFFGAENGETLSRTPQPVPGGLTGIIAPTWWPKFLQDWFNNGINEGLTGVYATVELTGPSEGLTNVHLNTENLIGEEGTALGLPVKIKLSNALLGSHCYIGSDASPVQLEFTTGTSGELEGDAGELSFNESFTLITIQGGKLVDGTYSAPGAHGCGGIFSFLVDPLVNAILGLPSSSGNAAVLEGVLEDANAAAVKASE
jgi:hypothetical protein